MQINRDTVRKNIIELLKEDEEFRYAVAGLIGYDSILKKFEQHDAKFDAIMEEIRDIKRVQVEHSRMLQELKVGFGSIGRRVGKGLERLILNIYRDQLRQLNIDPSRARRFEYVDYEGKYGLKGKRYEFDIVITNNHIDIL